MSASPAYTLTGTFSSLIGSDTGYVTIRLSGYSPQIPRISGGVLNTVFYQTVLGSSFSVTLYGNDQIVPGSTFYLVSVFDANSRPLLQNVPYVLQGSGTFDLSSLTPLVSAPPSIPTPPSTVGQNLFLAGPITGTAAPSYRVIAPADLQADVYSTAWQPVDGIEIQTVQQAINALPATGGTVDARFNSTAAALALGTIDPGSKNVTILFGPYSYTLTQIIARSNLKLIGAGSGDNTPTSNPTILTSTSLTTDVIVYGGTIPIQGLYFYGFRLKSAGSSNSNAGINFVCPQPTGNSGIWYSEFVDLKIGATGPGEFGFNDGNVIFDASTNAGNGVHQFNTFRRIVSIRTSSTATCMTFTGNCAQHYFYDCEVDGDFVNNTGTNILLGDGSSTPPVSPLNTFSFQNLTCQWSGVGVQLDGAWSILFNQTHWEHTNQLIKCTKNFSNGNIGIVVTNSLAGVSTLGGGSGAFVNLAAGVNSVSLMGNYVFPSSPDNYVLGSAGNVWGLNNFGPGGNSSAAVQALNTVANLNAGSVASTTSVTAGTSITAGTSVTAMTGFKQATTAVLNTSTFTTVGTFTGNSLFLLRDDDHGGNALVVIGDGSNVTVIQNFGSPTTFAVTGSPTSTQIGLQNASGLLQAKAGSGAGPHMNFTQIFAA